MSVIIEGKNPRKPHTVRYWADARQRERSFATAREATSRARPARCAAPAAASRRDPSDPTARQVSSHVGTHCRTGARGRTGPASASTAARRARVPR
jgi:hypothetical protein